MLELRNSNAYSDQKLAFFRPKISFWNFPGINVEDGKIDFYKNLEYHTFPNAGMLVFQ